MGKKEMGGGGGGGGGGGEEVDGEEGGERREGRRKDCAHTFLYYTPYSGETLESLLIWQFGEFSGKFNAHLIFQLYGITMHELAPPTSELSSAKVAR